ncbi:MULTISPECIES: SAM-dependent methyltransferase [unclassified Pseudonocardia]|uniref:SAM-dependent methyltransferase n=1 Tax=unclassified Pseudonocardia TaxID=2619320 RepID=UPI00094B64C0|nr:MULTISPECIES: SAM-dependent methyltransferase [unclassified Pseudonocardia]OLM14944.1 O-Methyltransferase involved in polyketide biosynthesis [Pseudonocardia sp. Ae505_Ps2]OLM32081.1 O-Methyltransferase involved in polyketide biosynthesis [Pseudonocardia sp. Ae717_Ps2]
MSGVPHGNVPAGGNSVPGGWDVTRSVGATALAVAAARAAEAERPDPLVVDPYARALVDAAAPGLPLPRGADDDGGVGWRALVDMMAIRTRVLDAALLAAAADGVRQVVVPAAGLDARPYRLAWPDGTSVYEIDQPEVLAHKQRVLGATAARARRVAVPCDLRDDWPGALRGSGFDPGRPTAWLVEGLLAYLPPEAEADLLARVDELSAPGSRVALEAVDLAVADEYLHTDEVRAMAPAMGSDLAQLWDTRRRPAPASVLRAAGWDVRERPLGELGADLGRQLTGPVGTLVAHVLIVEASR